MNDKIDEMPLSQIDLAQVGLVAILHISQDVPSRERRGILSQDALQHSHRFTMHAIFGT